MFGLGDNEEDEKMWNFMLFKFYATDKEMKEIYPTVAITTVVVIILWILLWVAFK